MDSPISCHSVDQIWHLSCGLLIFHYHQLNSLIFNANNHVIIYIQSWLENSGFRPVNAFHANANSKSNKWPAFNTDISCVFIPLGKNSNGFWPMNRDNRFCLPHLIWRRLAGERGEKMTCILSSPDVHTKDCGVSDTSMTCNCKSWP